MMKKFLFLWLFFAVLFAACTDDDDNVGEIPPPEVNKVQMIVVNEGLFGTGTADISVVYEDGTTIWNAFERANGVPMGDVAQSITYFNGKYFVVLNGSAKIEVVEPETFKSVGTILYTQKGSPRFMVPINDTEAIVTDLQGQLVRVNTSDYSVVEYIPLATNWGIEKIVKIGNKLFGANPAGKGIAVFDVNNISEEGKRIIRVLVKDNTKTSKMHLDKNNKLWVLTTGTNTQKENCVFWNCIDPNTEEVVDVVEIPLLKKGNPNLEIDTPMSGGLYYRSDISGDKSTIYFSMNACTDVKNGTYQLAVFELNVDTKDTKLYRKTTGVTQMYGMGVSPEGEVYVCDAIDYTAQRGYLRHFQENGSETAVKVGVYPRMIWFTGNETVPVK